MVNVVYAGPEEKGRQVIKPFLSANALESNVTMIPWNRLIRESRFGVDALGCIAGFNQAAYGLNLYQYDVSTYQSALEEYINFYATTNLTTSYMVTEIFPTRVTLQTADSMTAYPYRNTLAYT